MENVAADVIEILRYLLPGFLAAWVFYGFTSFEKPSQFERVIQALIFTLIVQVIVYLYRVIAQYWLIGPWNNDVALVVSVITATLIGFIFAYFSNSDKFHACIRKLGVSKETSYPSEWYGEFSNRVTYVVLHLDGERRLYGWPKEWPSVSYKGHFAIQQASWLDDGKEIPLTGVETILVPVREVHMVEFMKKTWE